jgi:hypothetical protein
MTILLGNLIPFLGFVAGRHDSEHAVEDADMASGPCAPAVVNPESVGGITLQYATEIAKAAAQIPSLLPQQTVEHLEHPVRPLFPHWEA